jgi:phosphatidylglycerophosphatase C
VACFDVDGTLVAGDSFRLFLAFLVRRRLIGVGGIASVAAAAALRKGHVISLAEAKERSLKGLAGRTESELDSLADDFVATRLRASIRRDIVKRLWAHRSAGDRVVLMTSAPDVYLRSFAAAIGAAESYGTRLEFDRSRFTGRLHTHLFGESKVQKLIEILGEQPRELFVYSDHHSDLPLLEAATHPFVVSPTPSLLRIAQSRGWATAH